jgi:hypothetical protein
MIVSSEHTILKFLGNESKVHVFQAIFFQEILPIRVKSHVARFPRYIPTCTIEQTRQATNLPQYDRSLQVASSI